MRDLVIGIGIIGAVIGAVCAVSIVSVTTPLLVPLLKGSFLGGGIGAAGAYLYALITDKEW